MKCLHCGKRNFGFGKGYCEECYQGLLSKNMKLEREKTEFKQLIYQMQKSKAKHMKEE